MNFSSSSSSSFFNGKNVKKLNGVSCFYSNVDQIMNKRAEFFHALEIYKPDIIAVVEVKPKNARFQIQESELSINEYEMFHNLQEEGRGIVLYVHNKLQPSLCSNIKSDFSEHLVVETKLNEGNGNLLICLVYRRQDLPKDNCDKLNALFETLSQHKAMHKLIVGDFNFPELDWITETSKASENHVATKFLKATKDSLFFQHQKTPTRYREGQRSNTLDLVFTDNDNLIEELKVEAPIGKSDHFSLMIQLSVSTAEVKKAPRRNFRKTDTETLKNELKNIDWDEELKDKDIDETWTQIKRNIVNAIDKSTPMTNPTGKKGKIWMRPDTLDTVRLKHKLFRDWHKTNNDKAKKSEYNKMNNKARKACRKANKAYEKKVAEESKKNPKIFFNYANSKIKNKSGIADLNKEDGTKTKTDYEKAELLNKFFQSVFVTEDPGPLPDFEGYEYDNELTDFDISEEAVRKILSGLDRNKASGPDDIPPCVLVDAATELAKPISVLFNRSLKSGKIPKDWKMAHVTPIYKKGNKAAVNNYRPVSLTCVLCKSMEKIVREKILQHLSANNIISPHQHGFVPGRSCMTQLLESMDDWTSIIEESGSVDIIYTDFQKAFDSVPHRRLIQKMKSAGINGSVLRWVEDFLANRKQRVVINGTKSNEGSVTSGIPQGSVLGPLLFVMYINDLPRNLNTVAKMFADDTKVYVRSDTPDGARNLQGDLDTLQNWSDKWMLKFHPDKCCVLKLGKDNDNKYEMGDATKGERITLKETEKEKDLGVIVDNKLSFSSHVAQTTAKANRMVGLIRRSFDFLNERTFVLLYKSMVRPLLEYGNSIWQPMLKGLESDIEDVQRRATKSLAHIRDKSYSERLKILKLPCLEHRRRRGCMIETYKFMHGYYDTTKPEFKKSNKEQLRGHSLKLDKTRCTTRIRANFLSNRITNDWNSLPNSVVTSPSIDTFKRRLDEHWKNIQTLYEPNCQS